MKKIKNLFLIAFAIMVFIPFVKVNAISEVVELSQADFDEALALGGEPTAKGISYDSEYDDFILAEGEYKLLEDIYFTYASIYVSDGDFVIDLNGKTISSGEDDATIGFVNGNLTIKGNGTVSNEAGESTFYTLENDEGKTSNIVLEDVTFSYDAYIRYANATIKNVNFSEYTYIRNSNVTIEDAVFNGKTTVNNSTLNIKSFEANDDIEFNGCELTIEDAKVNGQVDISEETVATINGGTYQNDSHTIIVANGATLIINDGTFISNDAYAINTLALPVYPDYYMGPIAKYLEINGGTFTGYYLAVCFSDVEKALLSGGTFKSINDDSGALEILIKDGSAPEDVYNAMLAEGSIWSDELEITNTYNIDNYYWYETQKEISVIDDKLTILEGGDQTYEEGKDIVIKASGNFNKFLGLKMDGEDIDKSNYTAVIGSTVVTLKDAYLSTLSEGKHTLTFVYKKGTVDTTITINSKEKQDDETITPADDEEEENEDASNIVPNPNTSDNIMLYIMMLGLSVIGLAIIRIKKFN